MCKRVTTLIFVGFIAACGGGGGGGGGGDSPPNPTFEPPPNIRILEPSASLTTSFSGALLRGSSEADVPITWRAVDILGQVPARVSSGEAVVGGVNCTLGACQSYEWTAHVSLSLGFQTIYVEAHNKSGAVVDTELINITRI